MSVYVYSTCTCSGTYVIYETGESARKDLSVAKKWSNGKPIRITINGGNGVADKHMYTPRGAVTILNDEEWAILKDNNAFKRHVAAGHITYDKKNIEIEKKVKDMANKDGSSPLTPADFVEGQNSSKDAKIYSSKGAPTIV